MKLLSLSAFLALSASLVAASPVDLDKRRIIWSPPVLYPHLGTVWQVGNHHNVTWSTENRPAGAKDQTGRIALAKAGRVVTANPIASGFKLSKGRVVIEVPKAPTGDDYSLLLMGDSDNFSAMFTIQN